MRSMEQGPRCHREAVPESDMPRSSRSFRLAHGTILRRSRARQFQTGGSKPVSPQIGGVILGFTGGNSATHGAGIDKIGNQTGECLMLGSRPAFCEKVSDLDFGRCSAGRHVGFVQDEDAAIAVAAEKPSVAILAVVKISR